MNEVTLTGRLCRDTELRTLNSGSVVTSFTLAVDRRRKADGADFIMCTAWGKTAELITKYVHKGDRIGIAGHIATSTYDNKEGIRQFKTEVIAEEVEFLGKSQGTQQAAKAPEPAGVPEGFTEISDDDELPF